MWDLQKYFSPVCILLVKFFLTNVLNVFPKLVTLKFFFNHHVLAVFEISVLKAVRILHNLHSNTNTKVKKISVSLSPAPFRGHIFHMRDNPYDLCFLQMLTKQKQLPAVIIFVDFSKAFDSIGRSKMEQILEASGIPNEITKAITIMYRSTQSFVRSPNGDTEFFDIIAGVL